MTFEANTDEELIGLVSAGELSALDDLYSRHSRAVYGFVYYLLRDPAKAEEVTQEVFVNVWQKATSYRAERGSFTTWVMTMAHHKAIDELRRTQRHRSAMENLTRHAAIEGEAVEGTPYESAQRAEAAEAVQRALQSLPQEQRQAIVLAHYHGYTQSEIADRLEQPLGTIKTRMRLGLRKLRTALAATQELS